MKYVKASTESSSARIFSDAVLRGLSSLAFSGDIIWNSDLPVFSFLDYGVGVVFVTLTSLFRFVGVDMELAVPEGPPLR